MRYFFHIRDGAVLTEDYEGSEFATMDDVREEARKGARQIVATWLLADKPVVDRAFEVYDEQGQLRLTMPFKAVLHSG